METGSHDLRRGPAIWAVLVIIAVLAALAYGRTLANGFVWDDETFIVNNAYVHDLSRWPGYFTRAESVTAAQDPGLLRLYRPLQTLSFAIDAACWGEWAGGYHLTSLLLHIGACWSVVFAFGPLVGRRAAALAAVVFAVHPALSEDVLSLAARGNQLSTLFALLSIGWFVRITRPFDRLHVLSVLAAVLSFFSKESSIVLPALLLLLQASFERPGRLRERSSVSLYLPYVAAAVLFLVARMAVVETSSLVPYWGGSLWRTALMQAKAFAIYLRLLVWPAPLLGRYPVPYSETLIVLYLLVNLAAVALGAVLFRRGRNGRFAALAIAWFYLSLAPVSNIIPIPGAMMGERFLYLTFAGMLPLLAAVVADAASVRFARTAAAVALCVVCLFVVMDMKRTAVWRDNLRFFAELAGQLPEEPIVQILMAKEEVLAGSPASAAKRLAPVIRRLLAYTPEDKTGAYYWYGRALLDSDRPREAFEQFAMIGLLTKSVPSEVVPYLAEAAARSGKAGYAESLLVGELERAPGNDVLWNTLGNVRSMLGDARGAVAAYERALGANPANREAAFNLMNARRTLTGR